jgi:hypothetical protein
MKEVNLSEGKVNEAIEVLEEDRLGNETDMMY